MNWETIRYRTKIAFNIISTMVGFVLAIAMIAQGVHRIYLGNNGSADPLYYTAYVIMILGGIAVAVLCRKDIIKMTGAYVITLGITRFLLRLEDIYSTDDVRIIFILIIFMVLALNLIRIGIHFARGNVVSRTSLIITSSIMAFADLLLMTLSQYDWEYHNILPFDLDPYLYLMNFLMYVAVVALLDTEIIRENMETAKQAKILDRVRSAYSLHKNSFIYDDVAKELIDRSGPDWKDINDDKVRSEMSFDIVFDEIESTAVAQVWKGKEPLFVTIVNKGDSIFNANRFRIDQLMESDGRLHGYGKDGTRFDILIKRRKSS